MVFEQNIQIQAQKPDLQFQVGLEMDVFSEGGEIRSLSRD